jgi:hypothetical protein
MDYCSINFLLVEPVEKFYVEVTRFDLANSGEEGIGE